MFKTIVSGHNIILGAQKNFGGLPLNAPRGYIRKVCYMNDIYAKLRHSLRSMCEIEINRKYINPSCSKPEIVPYLYLLTNCMNVSFIHFHHIHYLFLVYLRHFLNHLIIFFGPFRRPFCPAP